MKPVKLKKEQSFHNATDESSLQRVLGVLFQYPDKQFSLTDLAKNAKVAKANISKIIKKLEEMQFIEIEKLANIWRIKAIRTNQNFIKLKIIRNLSLIYESNLTEFLNKSLKHPKAIVLFGSFRKGEDITSSDIDIAIETTENPLGTFYLNEMVKEKESQKIENFLNRKVQLHLFNRKNVNINVFNNIANGIVLSGFLEVKP